MSKESRDNRKLIAIRSMSLEDVVLERHRRWRRLLRRRSTVLLLSLAAFSTAAGGAAYTVWGGAGTSGVLAYESTPARTASLVSETRQAPPKRNPAARPAVPKAAAVPQSAEPAIATLLAPAGETSIFRSARMPKPRPDEPVVTGSIAHAAPQPAAPRRYADNRRPRDPCQVLQAITARLPLRVHCF